jgi:hypothetical protein
MLTLNAPYKRTAGRLEDTRLTSSRLLVVTLRISHFRPVYHIGIKETGHGSDVKGDVETGCREMWGWKR